MNTRYPIRRHKMTRWEAKMIQMRLNWNNEDYWVNISDKIANGGVWAMILFIVILIVIALL